MMTIKEYLELYNKLDEEVDKLCDIFPTAFESSLIETSWIISDQLLQYVAKENDINIDALTWFIFDNDQGKNAYEVDGIPITDLDEFLFIEHAEKVNLEDGTVVYYQIKETAEKTTTVVYTPSNLNSEQLAELANMV